jgi:Ribbon-helix-helix protein, copG family
MAPRVQPIPATQAPREGKDTAGRARTFVIAADEDVQSNPRLSAGALPDLVRYHQISQEVSITDVLIRDVPDDVIAAVDAHAGRLGLSRSEYVRRRLAQDAAVHDTTVSVEDLSRFADVFGDLADPDVMSQAWR